MPDWIDLPVADRRELLLFAAGETGRDPALLEKDLWVVWVLGWIGRSPWAADIVFKGGTSLSKVHKAIDRFSEDIDLTYDIRRLVEAAGRMPPDPIPPSRAKADQWSKHARDALRAWIGDRFLPEFAEATETSGATLELDGEDAFVRYPSVLDLVPGYLRPAVKLEFGGRATGEPADWADIRCDIADALPADIGLPTARVRTMSASRTFWEKVTAMHVHCQQDKAPAERFARHWFDIACLHRSGHSAKASGDRELAARVVEHKSHFFRPSSAHGQVDLADCIQGKLRIQPQGERARELRADYDAMLSAGFLGSWRPDWDEVLALIAEVEDLINANG